MKVIVILTDSLRRDFLPGYGCDGVELPNLKRLQERSVIFDQHWVGSLPCMPARRDMMTGRLNFLERNWGPIEPFDRTIPEMLNEKGIFSHIVTDHYHYFEKGGENYCQSFNTWELIRGQEKDPWISRVNKPNVPEYIGQYPKQYHLNREKFTKEEEFSSPRTFQSAMNWLDNNKDADNYLLWIEVFDPHEPFDVPSELLDDDYDGALYMWPEYKKKTDIPEDALKHIRHRYSKLVEMTDRWIGKLLDKMDELNVWDDTMVIFTSDHGYMLGEHEYMAKNYMPIYNEIAHLPLMVHMPNGKYKGQRIQALTQNVDIYPTLMDFFSISEKNNHQLHGQSWLPLLKNENSKIREYAIYGSFGKNVNITDGKFTYFRAAVNEDNYPLNLYTAMPTTLLEILNENRLKNLNHIEMGRFLKWTKYPVYKFPSQEINFSDESLGFKYRGEFIGENLLFNIQYDYKQNNPITERAAEEKYIGLLKDALEEHDSPEEQYIRLGISGK